MKKEDILQFEEDDTSKMGINGKQVFFTKRINGKTTHNKIADEENESITFKDIQNFEEEPKDEEELYINIPVNKKEGTPDNVKNTKKKPAKKKRKKISRAQKIARLFIIILICIGTVIFAMISPIFNIENIEVKGNSKIASQTIISLSNIKEGSNIFRNSKKDIIKRVKENPYINNATVKRRLPGTLEITVEERIIAYQVKVIDSYVYLDYQGYILEISPEDGKVPRIIGLTTDIDTLLNEKRIMNDDINSFEALLKIMNAAKNSDIYKDIAIIRIENEKFILELNKDNKIVYLGDGTDLANKVAYLKAILENEKGKKGKIFINGDLNSGFKPYFREE